ncbi:MAG: hypothetical protein II986_02015 [Alistipes sp.]|nr:hypothetical protein [Alistipes sp.]
MKRVTAIIFVLLANISLLAHAVIPHHHHDRMAVAIVDMAAAAEQVHHEHSHDGHHSHDHHSHYHHSHNHHDNHQHGSQSEECLISETPAVLTRSQEVSFGDDGVDDAQQNLYFAVCEEFALPEVPEIPINFYTYRATIPPGVDVSSHGLRAPPHC